ncbi:uncharacterized protein LOC125224786 isoform X2 [Leguminivora glycinivorella]|nr:uncharacterized protein LOC125224786 isoform X2 [Leguminivora glycinivorella]XP_047984198.1 uncharacterized protein LOC125224786 isoform X2 [Leguminivora glycinivorella]
MDNPNFVLNFVKIVERHPVLYDQKLPHRTAALYSITWEKAAAEVRNELKVDCTVDDLKVKWKGIRSSYARFKRKLEKCSDGTKQYYLYDALSFLAPHTKHRQKLPRTENLDDYQDSDVEEWDPELPLQMLNEDTIASNISLPVCIGKNLELNSVKIEPIDENQLVDTTDISSDDNQQRPEETQALKRKGFTDIFETTAKVQKIEENADMQFFRSILPDIDNFTNSEKRQFKIGVLKLIDDIEHNRRNN